MSGLISRLASSGSKLSVLARSGAFGAAMLLAGAPVLPLASSAFAQEAQGPASLAPLVGQVMDAVVNIKASQIVEAKAAPAPDSPGGPLDDLFNDFFNRRGEGPGGGGDENRQRRGNSLGSGFVIDPSGIIVTNNHVIADANDVVVVFNDRTELKAKILGRDPRLILPF